MKKKDSRKAAKAKKARAQNLAARRAGNVVGGTLRSVADSKGQVRELARFR